VFSASAFGGFIVAAPGAWIEIYGSNLASDTTGWSAADFNNGTAPTLLDHVSVDIGGKPAFVDYVSPTQVDALLPFDLATGGDAPLTVTTGDGASTPFNVSIHPTAAGLLAPPSFKFGGSQYVVAQFVDGTYVLPAAAIAGITSRPAKPGETIVIYGVGFGGVTPNIAAGQIVNEANQLVLPLHIRFGQSTAQVRYAGLAPNLVGLYQFNVVVPDVADSDQVPVTFDLGGVAGTQTLVTAVHH
jgi:uncharacterized protein (TIGR03437 family)